MIASRPALFIAVRYARMAVRPLLWVLALTCPVVS